MRNSELKSTQYYRPATSYTAHIKSLLLLTCAVAFLTGCTTNPYTQYYQSCPISAADQQRLLPPAEQPQIISVSAENVENEVRRLRERNFILIGFSEFYNGEPTQSQLIEQVKKVGADIAIYGSEYSHTEQGVEPVLSYQPGQTYTTTQSGIANANVFGSSGYSYGSGTYSGTSMTTAPGAFHADYVPYQRRIYQHNAAFWRQWKPLRFGAYFAPIPDDLRRSLQRNTGVCVTLVTADSPAFRANILVGDIIIQLADKPVATPKELLDLIQSYAGQKVPVRVIRGTQTLDIDVQLGQ